MSTDHIATKVLKRLALFALALSIGGCTQEPPIRVRVVPGSSAHALALTLQGRDSLAEMRGLRVAWSRLRGSRGRGSQGHILWSLAAAGAHSRRIPQTVMYGNAPSGFVGSAAEGLTPGLYEVEILRDGPSDVAYFEIHNDGSISQ